MFIGYSPERSELTEKLSARRNILLHAGGDRVDAFDEIGKMPGMEVIERFDSANSHYFDCRDYVFGRRRREKWYDPRSDALEETMLGHPANFLISQGYNHTETPLSGDVAVYIHNPSWYPGPRAAHWGIYDQGKVISKFGAGHVYRHSFDLVPNFYGNRVLFFHPPTPRRMKIWAWFRRLLD
ncbi:hypothetical protein A3J19_03985 [Candidatus Daviesbacteria bacterium RIFCSPLOWO2_02_FULL_41_8]|uniref:DUF7689 domain-containing protein n=3 Tax=Candidatus Daviesiibacteriota TaxID=1752718 RepID=A0A1F5NLJ7_9BACT|nr:MAG: hypothetical protein A2871_03995 [Candidatus Daviesbacteria bacterium RIFCSPHIGHO2_01_FULL_41_23]OGE33873.1 MAG: hypothetical protein A3D83_00505 [Candidatus Daviesbacteria bacterium RIFCSPHIGHO2_02_FULL_41_10]OGE62296.1 MAG: hypothetical protein A2967_02475 [Candidatus Daviesbacteria bacterium RIFCSPLOWO2_01_FULL_41_32]OGE78392.1 MAG: hypothetical protein A3J19_03985 [Candidatus Daviesbacteria bacterium RIFCSPLOWO2_02_FULL_41_8]